MKRIFLSLVLVLAFSVPALAVERCDNCRMKVPDDSRYKVTVTLKDGGKKLTCSLFCASMVRERQSGEVAGTATVDYLTGEELKAEDAVWVEGSDARAVMSDKSRIAFKDSASAEAFVKEHGGRVTTFDEAYKDSVMEWKGK